MKKLLFVMCVAMAGCGSNDNQGDATFVPVVAGGSVQAVPLTDEPDASELKAKAAEVIAKAIKAQGKKPGDVVMVALASEKDSQAVYEQKWRIKMGDANANGYARVRLKGGDYKVDSNWVVEEVKVER